MLGEFIDSDFMLDLLQQVAHISQVPTVPLVLTTTPAAWLNAPAEASIYDLSPLRSWQDAQGQDQAQARRDWLCTQLPAWGWPQESIHKAFRYNFNGFLKIYDLSLEIKTQFAILMELLPEIELSSPQYQGLEYELENQAGEIGFDAYCISDGRSFTRALNEGDMHLKNWDFIETVSPGLPTPQDFGLDLPQGLPALKSLTSPAALREVLSNNPLQRPICIDPSLAVPLWKPDHFALQPAFRLEAQARILDWVLAELCQQTADVYLCLPARLWSSESSQPLREALLQVFHLKAWLEIEAPQTAEALILYCFSKQNSSAQLTWVEKHSTAELSQSPESLQPLAHYLAGQPVETPHTAVLWPTNAATPWRQTRILPDSALLPPGFLDQGPWLRLAELAELAEIQAPNSLRPESPTHAQPPLLSLQSEGGQWVLREVSALFEPQNSLGWIRLRPETSQQYPSCDSAYLTAYFESEPIQAYLKARCADSENQVLSLQILAHLPVLLLDTETGLFAQLAQLGQQLSQTTAQFSRVSSAFFQVGPQSERLQTLFQWRATAELMLASAENLQKTDYQICHFYPFALAYPYRHLQTLRYPLERYKEQLRLVENLLAYLVGLILALLKHFHKPTSLPAQLLETLRKKGVSPGYWRQLYQTGLESLADETPQFKLLNDLARLKLHQQQSGLGQLLNHMLKAKNDFKHDRGPQTEADVAWASEQLQKDLDQLLGALNFLKDYPLWQVQNMDISRDSGLFELTCLRHQGDHPALHQESLLSRQGFSRHDLIMALAEHSYLSLYPYLSVGFCPQCHHREVYFMDHFQASDLVLKSFERGHTIQAPDLASSLSQLAIPPTPP